MNTLAHLEVGTVFAADFRVIRRLSQGGMGTVYVVEQLSTGKQRALKLMLPQLVSDASLRKRFEQEARVGAHIESEHIVDVVGAGVDAATGTPWLAMELLQGEDLAARVQRAGALPLDELRAVLGQLCHAIAAAHAAGVVHRDLKPENVFLAQARRAGVSITVKVLDFGIAKLVAESRTTATAAIGSPAWMAPEQTARGSAIGPTADVWAIGLITFFLLTGRHYFRAADDETATLAALLREVVLDPLPLASQRALELGKPLPAGFDDWFARAVQRDVAARFASVAELHAAFERLFSAGPVAKTLALDAVGAERTVLADAGSAPARTLSTTVGVEAAMPARRSSRAAILALGGALLLLGGGALALTKPWQGSTPDPSAAAASASALPAAAAPAPSSAPSVVTSASAGPESTTSAPKVTLAAPAKPTPTPAPSQPTRVTPTTPTKPELEPLPPSPMLPNQPSIPSIPTRPPTPVPPSPSEPNPTQQPTPNLPTLPDSPFKRSGRQGFLNIDSVPSSDCYLDGRFLGKTPQTQVPAAAGSHGVRFVSSAEGIDRTISITVTAGETRSVFRRLRARN
ncbi:MAG: serine/threonine-protein kinase [Polyangiaceae bacterium]